ncbi:MAG: hypothetical protein GF372_02985 [Candidatus Marinimicrobia bacterium]|nr:hypothetical protein [Candidatus Neomarinimicrobiota bacterium]
MSYLGKVLIILLVPISLYGQLEPDKFNYYSLENRLIFADYLYKTNDFLRAASEYQELLNRIHTDKERDSLKYKLALSYYQANRPEISLSYSIKLYDKADPNSEYVILHLLNYLKLKNYGVLLSEYKQLKENKSPLLSYPKIQLLGGMGYFYQKEWNNSADYFNNLIESNKKKNTLVSNMEIEFYNLSVEGRNLKKRSPLFSGILSAIIPGLGRLYVGRTGDAVTSFLTIGFLGIQSYNAFSRNGINSFYGWVAGITTSFIYLGNVYGSVTAAHIYNYEQEQRILNATKIPYDQILFD